MNWHHVGMRVDRHFPSLLPAIRRRYALDWHGIHGAAHWARVRWNGHAVAAISGADPIVVELFAWLHDACRRDDGHDPEHGPRAAALASEWNGVHFTLDRRRLALLTEACDGHTHLRHHADPTIQTCWDADRLDIARVMWDIDPYWLGTAAARDLELRATCRQRSTRWVRTRAGKARSG